MARRRAAALLVLVSACHNPAYVDLQIAKDRLPFPRPGTDFDRIGVEARAAKCANTVVKYPAMVLPATLTVEPGECFKNQIQLQAFTLLGETRIAESNWLEVAFPASGELVVTATIADLLVKRQTFHTGFEVGDPIGASDNVLHVLDAAEIPDLSLTIDETLAFTGSRSVEMKGTASSTGAYALALVATPDFLIGSGDQLSFALRIDQAAALTLGIDVTIDDGRTATTLMLADPKNGPIEPSTPKTQMLGQWTKYTVDLSRAAGARLEDVIFGFDSRVHGKKGAFVAHVDEIDIGPP